MDCTLTRNSFNSWGIVSTLTSYDGIYSWVTLEHAYLQPDGSYLPKVPNGTFTCVLGTHQLEHGGPFQTYEITGVEGHQGILFHKGNYNQDSDGCVLLGTSLGTEMILDSADAFQGFINHQDDIGEFTLTVA